MGNSEAEAKIQMSVKVQLNDFPDEIILKILANLEVKDILQCSQVCKRFNTISTDEKLYHTIDLSKMEISTRIIELIL